MNLPPGLPLQAAWETLSHEDQPSVAHADLYPGNIHVARSSEESQARASRIVVWEQAGWYPDYWEYCKTMILGRYGDEWKEQG